jgi:hypothetical protein
MDKSLSVVCPFCGAPVGYSCQSPSGYARPAVHRSRIMELAKVVVEEALGKADE